MVTLRMQEIMVIPRKELERKKGSSKIGKNSFSHARAGVGCPPVERPRGEVFQNEER